VDREMNCWFGRLIKMRVESEMVKVVLREDVNGLVVCNDVNPGSRYPQ